MTTIKDMKAFIRQKLSDNPLLKTESEKRSMLKRECPFKPSELRYNDFMKAVTSVLTEKPSRKIADKLENSPDYIKRWAADRDLLK